MGQIDIRLQFLDTAMPEDLDDLELLEKLRRRLAASWVQPYTYFKNTEPDGCEKVSKALDKFVVMDLEKLTELITILEKRLNRG